MFPIQTTPRSVILKQSNILTGSKRPAESETVSTSPKRAYISSEDTNSITPVRDAKNRTHIIENPPLGTQPNPNTKQILQKTAKVVEKQAKLIGESPDALSERDYQKLHSKTSPKGLFPNQMTPRSVILRQGKKAEKTETVPTSPKRDSISSEQTNMVTPIREANKLAYTIENLPLGTQPTPNTKQILQKTAQVVQKQAEVIGESPGALSERYYERLRSKAREKGEKAVSTVRSSPWAPGCIEELTQGLSQERKTKLETLVDIEHIVTPTKGGGLHYIPTTSTLWGSMQSIIQSPQSGAVSAIWNIRKGRLKCSSLFDPTLTMENIKDIWEQKSVLSEYDPKNPQDALVESKINGRKLLFEKKSDPIRMITRSFYPVFLYISPQEINDFEREIVITQETTLRKDPSPRISILSNRVREIATNVLDSKSYEKVRYTNSINSSVIIDIAEQVFGDSMRKGVYAEIVVSPEELHSIRQGIQETSIIGGKNRAIAPSSSSTTSSSGAEGSGTRSPERTQKPVIFKTPDRK